MRVDVMGVLFDNVTMGEALEKARGLLSGGTHYCVTPNPEIVWEAMHDSSFRALLNGADLVLPDGVGVLLGAKILGTPLREKVTGADFAAALLPVLEESGKSLYLLGSRPGVAEQAAANLTAKHPQLKICGMHDGYFQEDGPVVGAIRQAAPDALFVCMGSPRQERFMADHAAELAVPLMIGLGGTLDVFAGNVRRAPVWMQRMGLEWFYRLCREPKRLGRMMRLPKFVLAVLGRRLRGGKA